MRLPTPSKGGELRPRRAVISYNISLVHFFLDFLKKSAYTGATFALGSLLNPRKSASFSQTSDSVAGKETGNIVNKAAHQKVVVYDWR
jgi:hypothetical protein